MGAGRHERGAPDEQRGEHAERSSGGEPLDAIAAQPTGGDVAGDRARDGRNEDHAAQLTQRGRTKDGAAGYRCEQEVHHVGRFRCERSAPRARAEAEGDEDRDPQAEHRRAAVGDVGDVRSGGPAAAQGGGGVEQRDGGDDHGHVRLVERVDPVALAQVVPPTSPPQPTGRRPSARATVHAHLGRSRFQPFGRAPTRHVPNVGDGTTMDAHRRPNFPTGTATGPRMT